MKRSETSKTTTAPDYETQDGFMFFIESMDFIYYFFELHCEPLVSSEDELRKELDPFEIKLLFTTSLDDGFGRDKLDELYAPHNDNSAIFANHPSNINQILDRVAQNIISPHVVVKDKQYYVKLDMENDQKRAEETAAVLAKEKFEESDSYPVKLRVVDDRTGEPVPSIKVTVEMPDSSVTNLESRPEGSILTSTKIKGSYKIKTYDYNPATMSLSNSWHFVGFGETPIESPGKNTLFAECLQDKFLEKAKKDQSKKQHLIHINPHKKTKDNCLLKVSQFEDSKNKALSYDELIYFNWGDKKQENVEKEMGHDLGNFEKADSGKPRVPEDAPDKVYKPGEWEKKGLSTQKIYTIRVKQMGRGIRFYYELGGIDSYGSDTDTNIKEKIREEGVTLWLDEDNTIKKSRWAYQVGVEQFRTLKGLEQGCVELLFPLPPDSIKKSGKFTLSHHFKEMSSPENIFEKVSFSSFYKEESTDKKQ
ncbi:MAG: hypothetical protein GY710_25740 [Desulfobacteraceae bacterium]|nr:hypothetical protein [Desulfobacteraceae bacterium]